MYSRVLLMLEMDERAYREQWFEQNEILKLRLHEKREEITRVLNIGCRLPGDGGWVHQNNPALNIDNAIIWHGSNLAETPEDKSGDSYAKMSEGLMQFMISNKLCAEDEAERVIQKLYKGRGEIGRKYLSIDGDNVALINQLYYFTLIFKTTYEEEYLRKKCRVAFLATSLDKNKNAAPYAALFGNSIFERKLVREVFEFGGLSELRPAKKNILKI